MTQTPGDLNRPLTPEERAKVQRARDKAFILYEGLQVPHRSCGIALAETFNLPARPYQCLRRGGITGEGECGAIKAGELVLGEYLGDPDPAGMVTPILREAVQRYRAEWIRRVDRGFCGAQQPPGAVPDIICNHLTAPFGEFHSPERQKFCTNIAAQVAEILAEILVRCGVEFEVTPIPGVERKN